MPDPTPWLVPDWDAPSHVRAVMTLRGGGSSAPPFDTMNLGAHVGDDPDAVARNRALFRALLEVRPVLLNQVHGRAVARLTADAADGQQADACLTSTTGLACTVLVADCLPLLLTNGQGNLVAAAHAGWRGLAGEGGCGVVETVVAAFRAAMVQQSPSGPGLPQQAADDRLVDETRVWLGPCIGQEAFEVGEDVRSAFVRSDPGAAVMFRAGRTGKFHADLQGLARRRLRALGIHRLFGNDGDPAWCTSANPSRFFSHRRDQVALGGTGRMAAAIWLT